MRIVVLDGYTLNPGDLSWDELRALGETIIYERTSEDLLLSRAEKAEVLLSNKVPIRAEAIKNLPDLRYIGVTATGYNIIDIEEAHLRKITVTNVPDYGSQAVAQHTFALILELSNQVGLHHQSVQAGEWSSCPDWTYTRRPIIELADKVLGLVGYGKIGQKVAQIARAFGMKVLYHQRNPNSDALDQYLSLEELFTQSDFISLHLPLTAENRELVNTDLLQKMKPTAFLINTARGALIQEYDLAQALKKGQIAGAALDVLSQEPPLADHPLLHSPNTILTPHNAWVAREARQRLLHISIENLKAYLSGKPQNAVGG